jgi:hypothetical protein
MGTQTHSGVVIPLLLIWACLSAWGQQSSENVPTPRLVMPEWLAPFAQARDQSATATSTESVSTYTALAHPAEVISHYQQQMRAAGVAFRTQSDGIGFSILASAEKLSAVPLYLGSQSHHGHTVHASRRPKAREGPGHWIAPAADDKPERRDRRSMPAPGPGSTPTRGRSRTFRVFSVKGAIECF